MLSMARGQIRRSGAVTLAPGVIDAGLGALAGLGGSLYATRVFDVDQLGLIARLLSRVQLVRRSPARLLLIPAPVAALDLPVPDAHLY